MSAEVKADPIPMYETNYFYTLESLGFARRLLSDLEHELKEKAVQLTLASGRDTVTEEDMRQAADEILGPVGGQDDDSDVDDV
jgi:hypothetical protein